MRPLILAVLLASLPAAAHFRFLLPDGGTIDWLRVDNVGDPVNSGGTVIVPEAQKVNPCGPSAGQMGTVVQSNIVTTLQAGSTYGVRIQETVTHGGHYRVALAQDPAMIPAPTAAAGCASRTPPAVVAPVLLDGQLQHTQAQPFPGPQTINITVPNQNCTNCWLQVVEFMTPHAEPCFYYHCAKVNIVGGSGAGGGSGTAGGTGATAGGSGSAGGTGATAGGTGATAGGTGATAGGTGTAGGSGSAGSTAGAGGVDEGGCACSGGGAGAALLALVALGGVLRRRRAS